MTLAGVLMILALICFILGAFGVAVSRVSLTDLGLAFLTGSLLVGANLIG